MDDVKCSGPLFDGTAERAAVDGTDAIRDKLATEGQRIARSLLAADIRHEHSGRALDSITTTRVSRDYQTGKYSLPVVIEDLATDTAVTTDLATYGPWLLGFGSRNTTTRFHGYNVMRLAAQELDRAARSIAEYAFAPYVRRMN